MKDIHSFIATQKDEISEILIDLNNVLMETPGMTFKIRYNIPFYYRKTWICYLNPVKRNGVELAFIRANELSNDHGVLDFKERKQVAGITFYDKSEMNMELLRPVIQEAILLDDTVPYTYKKSKKNP